MSGTALRIEPMTFEVTERDAAQWSELLDDRNPLHSDPQVAADSGIGHGIVNPGPANMGYLMTLVLSRFPAATLESFTARFVAAVLAPTSVVAVGAVESEQRVPEGRRLRCALQLHCGGDVAVVADAVLLIGSGEEAAAS